MGEERHCDFPWERSGQVVPGLGRPSEMGGDGADQALLEGYPQGPQPCTTKGTGTKSRPWRKYAEKVKEKKIYGGGDDEYAQQKSRGKRRNDGQRERWLQDLGFRPNRSSLGAPQIPASLGPPLGHGRIPEPRGAPHKQRGGS